MTRRDYLFKGIMLFGIDFNMGQLSDNEKRPTFFMYVQPNKAQSTIEKIKAFNFILDLPMDEISNCIVDDESLLLWKQNFPDE